MRFDLTDLRVFLHAYESGSMTGAASRAHLTLAAVSARIRALEDDAQLPLLRRHARGVAATPAGETLARHARIVLQQVDQLRRELAPAAVADPDTTVLLGNSSALARPLAGLLAEALASHPGARVVVRESASEVTAQALRLGAAHLGIVSDAVDTEGLVAQPLGDDPLVLVVAASHRLAHESAVSFRRLLEQDWVGWSEPAALHTHLAMHAFRAGSAIRYRAAIPSVRGVLELVARGVGLTVLPAALLPPGAREGLAVRPLEEAWAQRRLLLCRGMAAETPAGRHLAEAVRSRWDALAADAR
ncbi:LysR substrate-binding domain-containing protein [Ramlibacter humi]|uniref:LysR family transcriptional regulator n=1 Tax=Ramlibacter humi TaxID=2530451 RepID=A0A4Z0CBX8_9BURK|nr:LysR substrate-binding domain-containing protein [Ramlibacter humi]TFZ07675.1 LysR family transcriptional regulator [Ramlibacter humi]